MGFAALVLRDGKIFNASLYNSFSECFGRMLHLSEEVARLRIDTLKRQEKTYILIYSDFIICSI